MRRLVYVVSLGEVNGLTVKSASHEVDIQKNSDAAGSPDKKGVRAFGGKAGRGSLPILFLKFLMLHQGAKDGEATQHG